VVNIDDEMATAILKEAEDSGAYQWPIPASAEERISDARQMVAFAIDARLNSGIREDDPETIVSNAGKRILRIIELANIQPNDETLRFAYKDLSR
jgi:hypothetical protein